MVKILISGAGPAGLLLAQHLIARPNHEVHVFEKRPDLSTIPPSEDRTYPMSLQASGLEALEAVPGLQESLEEHGKWMSKVQVYQNDKPRTIQRDNPYFFIERSSLTRGLLEYLRETDRTVSTDDDDDDRASSTRHARAPTSSLSLHFNCGIENIFLNNQTVLTEHGDYEPFDHVVAADGARSVIRTKLGEDAANGLEYSLERLADSYRSLSYNNNGEYEPDRMHGWFVKGTDQVMSVPVRDDVLTGVYVFPNDKDPFEGMTEPCQVLEYLASFSGKLRNAMTHADAERLLSRGKSTSWKVTCNTLTVGDGKVVLIGDAAHALSASIGLGGNSALQDAHVLRQMLDKHDGDWPKALEEYNRERLKDAHAVGKLSDLARPRTKLMLTEMLARGVLRRALPNFITKRMRPLPMDVTNQRGVRFSEMFEQTRWWTSRVERSMQKQT